MKNYNFSAIFQNFNENFSIFTKFLKISRIFRENLRTNQNYAVVRGSGGGAPPDAGENFKNFYSKTNEKLPF